MKTYLFLIICLLTACSTSKNPSQHQLMKEQEVSDKVQARNYVIEVDQALPMRGRSISLSYGYDLKIKNDSTIAYLPYFGVAQSAPYGGGEGGIKFAAPMENYQITPKKKGDGWDVKFKVNVPDYNYEFIIDIFKNGSSSIFVNSYQRDAITFNGDMKLN